MGSFVMPALGADMDSGTLLEWRVRPGDTVRRGDIVAVVQTDKADIEVEVFEDGRVSELLVDEGAEVPVGTPLATLTGAVTETVPAAIPAAPRAPAMAAPQPKEAHREEPHFASPVVRKLATHLGVDARAVQPTGAAGRITRDDVERAAGKARAPAPTPPAPPAPAAPAARRVQATPAARRAASAAGIDLATLAGTGPQGAVRLADVERASVQPSPPVKGRAGVAARADAAQRAVGELMARSKREIPHYYLSDDLDVTDALAWLRQANEARPVTGRLLPAALLLRAVVRAALEAPELNGHWIDGSFRASKAVHLAIAVSTRAGGLLAPVIPDAHLLPLDDLMQAMQDAVARARTGTLRSADVEEATITVTNLGDQGAGAVWGVIVPPQVAIVGFGRIGQRPWAVDGLIGVRDIVTVTLAADHRASHGHRGSRFLAAIDHALRRPEDL